MISITAVDCGTPIALDPAEALAIARDVRPLPHTGIAPDDTLGLAVGTSVRVSPTDYAECGFVGELVGTTIDSLSTSASHSPHGGICALLHVKLLAPAVAPSTGLPVQVVVAFGGFATITCLAGGPARQGRLPVRTTPISAFAELFLSAMVSRDTLPSDSVFGLKAVASGAVLMTVVVAVSDTSVMQTAPRRRRPRSSRCSPAASCRPPRRRCRWSA